MAWCHVVIDEFGVKEGPLARRPPLGNTEFDLRVEAYLAVLEKIVIQRLFDSA